MAMDDKPLAGVHEALPACGPLSPAEMRADALGPALVPALPGAWSLQQWNGIKATPTPSGVSVGQALVDGSRAASGRDLPPRLETGLRSIGAAADFENTAAGPISRRVGGAGETCVQEEPLNLSSVIRVPLGVGPAKSSSVVSRSPTRSIGMG